VTTSAPIGYPTYRGYLDLLLDRMQDRLAAEGLLACALFGSVARGQARPDSDIDLLAVVSRTRADTMLRFVRLLREIETAPLVAELKASGLSADPYPVFVTPQDLETRPLILLDILDHGIILCDTGVLRDRLDRLQRRLRELGARKIPHPDGTWHWDLKPDWKPGEVIEL
jgi:predicted nucleotidyltransferase